MEVDRSMFDALKYNNTGRARPHKRLKWYPYLYDA